jgi:hypothetical protein
MLCSCSIIMWKKNPNTQLGFLVICDFQAIFLSFLYNWIIYSTSCFYIQYILHGYSKDVTVGTIKCMDEVTSNMWLPDSKSIQILLPTGFWIYLVLCCEFRYYNYLLLYGISLSFHFYQGIETYICFGRTILQCGYVLLLKDFTIKNGNMYTSRHTTTRV